MNILFSPPPEFRDLALRFKSIGKKAYIVGGALRDALLKRPLSDYDIATDASPEEVISLFRRVIPTGIKHGTVTVFLRSRKVEITTFRTEEGYSDGRHPDKVHFTSSIEQDLARRDFTVNAMAWDILGRELVDPYGGRADLSRRLIRAVGDAEERFAEDGLRPLRALRFSAQLGFSLEEKTLAAIPGAIERYRMVSAERVRDEFSKILLSPRPSAGLRLMESTGLLFESLPELRACRGQSQKDCHRFDVLDHLYASADAAPADLVLRLAALFHDAGKPDALAEGQDGLPTFYRHEAASALIAKKALSRLCYPNAVIEAVVHLVEQHMFKYEEQWSDAAVRRFVARVGPAHVDALLRLRAADTAGKTGSPPDLRPLADFRARIDRLIAQGPALRIKDLALSGEDLAAIGVERGPMMGEILRELLETVLDDPEQNEKQRLLRIAASLLRKRSAGGF